MNGTAAHLQRRVRHFRTGHKRHRAFTIPVLKRPAMSIPGHDGEARGRRGTKHPLGLLRRRRRRRRLALLSLLLFGVAKACLGQDSPARGEQGSEAPGQGRQIFVSRCASCHGLDGRGGERAPGIANSAASQASTDKALMQIIREGIPAAGMPSFRRLPDTELRALVQHLRFLGGKVAAEEVKGDAVRGERLFFGKGRCGGCHIIAGRGGFIGPDLSEQGSTRAPDQIRKSIVNRDRVLPPGQEMVSVETKKGEHLSGLVRNEDNFSLQLLGVDGIFHLLMKSQIDKLVRDTRSLMPADYGSQLSFGELDDLVSYIVRSARPASSSTSSEESHRRRTRQEERTRYPKPRKVAP
jgi:cytochrome c oxidase cbb3-type subunit III